MDTELRVTSRTMPTERDFGLRALCRKWVLVDRDGWPVETIRGQPFRNMLRRLRHGRRFIRFEGVMQQVLRKAVEKKMRQFSQEQEHALLHGTGGTEEPVGFMLGHPVVESRDLPEMGPVVFGSFPMPRKEDR